MVLDLFVAIGRTVLSVSCPRAGIQGYRILSSNYPILSCQCAQLFKASALGLCPVFYVSVLNDSNIHFSHKIVTLIHIPVLLG